MKYSIIFLTKKANYTQHLSKKGVWVASRPYNASNLFERIKHAWGVITGKYDVVEWED